MFCVMWQEGILFTIQVKISMGEAKSSQQLRNKSGRKRFPVCLKNCPSLFTAVFFDI